MIKITLPDGSVKELAKGSSAMDVAKSISEGLARNVISAKVNGTTVETTTPITEDATVVLYTFDQEEGKKAFWHSSAHVLAQALEKLYPGIKLTIGPAIENGFYYDVDPGKHVIQKKRPQENWKILFLDPAPSKKQLFKMASCFLKQKAINQK